MAISKWVELYWLISNEAKNYQLLLILLNFYVFLISFYSFFIQKLFHIYVQNEIDYMFLDDMLKSSEQQIQSCAHDALLWLKRYVYAFWFEPKNQKNLTIPSQQTLIFGSVYITVFA